MVINKKDLIEAVATEIEDRTTQSNECGSPQDYQEELKGLAALLVKVNNEQDMTYAEYEWLAYLVANWREAQLREELE